MGFLGQRCIYPMQWRSKGGGRWGGPPPAALFGGGKIEVVPKNLERVKVF